jgi:hypothetical protein
MNCQQCQEKILDALAAGANHVAPEIAAHQSSCPACARFFATQQSLLQSIDATLQSVVNQPVPPSLLPAVRTRLHEGPAPQRSRLLSWNLAAVASLAIIAFVASYALHRPGNAVSSRQVVSSPPRQSVAPQVVRHNATTRLRPSATRVLPVSTPAGTPEVIVLAEEREAFAKFVAEVPEQPQVAVAITHPAPAASDTPIEIALLHIERIQLKPLDPTATE